MAGNLPAADYGLMVHSRTRARAEPLAEHGSEVAHSPGEVAEACGVTYLPIRSSASAVPGVVGSQRRNAP